MIARALAIRPRLLLADEPTALLDAGAGARVMTLLRGLSLKGTTCLVATQAAEVARALDGRVLWLAAGRLRLEGDGV
jgi:putative ABC transport system ATP-binding protein